VGDGVLSTGSRFVESADTTTKGYGNHQSGLNVHIIIINQ
jgi:hypothetical protein